MTEVPLCPLRLGSHFAPQRPLLITVPSRSATAAVAPPLTESLGSHELVQLVAVSFSGSSYLFIWPHLGTDPLVICLWKWSA